MIVPNAIDTTAIADYLIAGIAPRARPQDVVAGYCERLAAAGVALGRFALFVRTLHPDHIGRSWMWWPGRGVEAVLGTYAEIETPDYALSPFAIVNRTLQPYRERLDGPAEPAAPALKRLRAEGAIDYLAVPLPFFDGSVQAATYATWRPGGFTDAEIAAMVALGPSVTRVSEIYALRRIVANLLDAYVGHRSGERILAGHIRRGDTEAIDAAIWLSDLRDFTSMSDALPGPEIIARLNRHFDRVVPPIEAAGGEVLKFIGDAVLAIFPVGPGDGVAAACDAAWRAARAVCDAPPADDEHPFRIALHAGTVLYGNIGGGRRVDFTAIGPAVNFAARLSALAGDLGERLVASAEFARHAGQSLRRRGAYELRGISGVQEVYVPSANPGSGQNGAPGT